MVVEENKAALFLRSMKPIGAVPALWPLAFLVFISAFLSFISLRALGSMVPVAFLFSLALFVFQNRVFPKPSPLLLATWVLFVALIGLAAARSLDIDYALGRFGKLILMSGIALLFWSLAARIENLNALQSLLVIAFSIGLALCLFEGVSDGLIFWLTHDVSRIEATHTTNRPVVLVVLFVWPTALVLSRLVGQKSMALMVLLTLVASFTTESQSAQLAALLATGVLVSSMLLPRLTLWAVGIGGVALILTLPFVFAFFDLMPAESTDFVSRATVLPRIELWTFVSQKILLHPLLGYGLEAGRFLPLDDMTQKYFGGAFMHHPHNGILQVWFEMGALGAVLLALGWGLLVAMVGKTSASVQSYVLAGLVCALVVSTVSHGLWQTWWVSALVILPVFYAIAKAKPALAE